MTSFHKNLVDAVAAALQKIFRERKYADAVIESVLKQNPKWGARDRRFIAETTYDVVRWWRWIVECGELNVDDEIIFHSAIGAWFTLQQTELPEWMKKEISSEKIFQNQERLQNIRAVREAIPDWLDQLGEKEVGGEWENELHALNTQARVVLRVNTLKTSAKQLRETLLLANVETEMVPDSGDALLLKQRMNVFQTTAFRNGLFEVQDVSSQQVAPFTGVQEGARVIDACAGAGGKTLHLAALMRNKGHIIALDTEEWKLQELKRRARRGGATIIETRWIENSKVIKRLHDSADLVLLDVPCSGLGVLRRNPDAKWKLSAEHIDKMIVAQKEILERYSRMVKPGGTLVYATCSILRSENQNQVQQFLSLNDQFLLEEEKQIFPSDGFDGFYMARMRKR